MLRKYRGLIKLNLGGFLARRSPAYKRFLGRLRDARAKARLTQVEAARRLRRHQSFVSKSESGERRVDVIELREFAELYGVPVTYFLG